MKTKQSIIVILIIISSIGISGCKKDEPTLYNRNIVVDSKVLPFYESSLSYNAEPDDQIQSMLYSIINETLSNLPGSIEYVIVNHDGKDLTEEFLINKSPSHKEMQDMIKRIKDNAYLVVNKEKYRVTTIEKEIEALFSGERTTVRPEVLEKVIKDNKEAYENKEYASINLYLRKNNIQIFEKLDFGQ